MKKIKLKIAVIFLSCALATHTQAGLVKKVEKTVLIGVGAAAALHVLSQNAKRGYPSFPKITGDENSADPLSDGEKEFGLISRVNTTKELRKNLNAEIRSSTASGMPPEDPDGCEAHHIAPQAEKRPWATPYTDMAKDALENCVDMDGAENGIYLPTKKNAECTGSNHKKIHTKAYYKDIAARLSAANSLGGCPDVKHELQLIKQELFQGRIW